MKKQYIKPESHPVVIHLMGSVLNYTGSLIEGSKGADQLSREQASNRFEDTDESWEVE